MQTLHKAVSQHRPAPALSDMWSFKSLSLSMCDALMTVLVMQLSAGISRRNVISLSNYSCEILYLQDWLTHKKTTKLAFFNHKNESNFLFLLPNTHALLVFITNSSLQSSPNIPIPQGCHWKELFSVHRATFFLIALWLCSYENQMEYPLVMKMR